MSNAVPVTRPWCSACDDTSIATGCAPASRNFARRRCSGEALGVVKPVYTSWGGMPLPSVPMIAQRVPAAVSADEIHWLHDVLPFVPVTPTTSIASLGSLYQPLAIEPASSFSAG